MSNPFDVPLNITQRQMRELQCWLKDVMESNDIDALATYEVFDDGSVSFNLRHVGGGEYSADFVGLEFKVSDE